LELNLLICSIQYHISMLWHKHTIYNRQLLLVTARAEVVVVILDGFGC